MTYRTWKYEDILRISQLERECFTDPWSYETLATCFQLPSFLGVLAEEEGETEGYAVVTTGFDSADVERVAVLEQYRRGGVATGLLDEAERVCREKGMTSAFIEVRVSNTPALMLYLGRGYTGLYARSRYYPDGEDCLVMKKTF